MPLPNPLLIKLLDDIRNDVVHILRHQQPQPPSGRAVELVIETLKIVTDTVWRAVETERLWAETEKMKAETEKIVVEKR